MAGIGIKLQDILKDRSYRSLLKGYIYAGLISAGPWLLAVIGVAIIQVLGAWMVPRDELEAFLGVIVYTYAGSLILTGAIQMATTRYVADRLFAEDMSALTPCYNWVATVVVVAGGLVAGAFHSVAGLDPAAAVGSVVLFQALSLTWVGMIFLSAAKDYEAVVSSCAVGYGASVAGWLVGALYGGVPGMIWGFALGQVVLAVLYGTRIRAEFPSSKATDSRVFQHWRTMPQLVVIGIFYSVGIWADKIVFWFGPWGKHITGWFYTAPHYNTCIFLAYLTVVPSMALFLIRVEAGFYKHYTAFYNTIVGGGDLKSVRRQKQEMEDALWLSAIRLVKLQGIVTLTFIFVAPWVLRGLGLPLNLTPTFRTTLLAAFGQVLLQFLLIFLLYFDWKRDVALLTIAFAVMNAAFSYGTVHLDPRFHGFGYLLACLIALGIGVLVFDRRMQGLVRESFSKQRIRA